MKKLMLVLALILVRTAHAGDAPAQGWEKPAQPMKERQMQQHQASLFYACRLDGDLKGVKAGFGIGAEVLGGRGMITCYERHQGQVKQIQLPVKVTIVGAGLSYDATYVRHVNMSTGGFGYVYDPMDLTGTFSVGSSAGVTLVERGYNVQSAVSVKKHAKGLAFELGFSGEEAYGLGARLLGTMMFVKPVHARQSDKNERK